MEGTIAEIRMFGGNFAPRGWFFCNGQLLSIAQNTAFFSLLGTTYGGDGQVTFGLPDFRGRVAVGTGNGAGLPSVQLGEMSGLNTTTLLSINLPAHNHQVSGNINMQASTDGGLISDPNGRYLGPGAFYTTPTGPGDLVNLASTAVNLPTTIAGSNSPVSIMQPYTGMNYIVCSEGIYPSRN
jgi:microcystin-dependent protein